ncbi:hypothetical protein G6F68_015341 [Rhizopus microsporus]|nr:hypothetical protein G6F68_015341 [Rhizopus microsporus]
MLASLPEGTRMIATGVITPFMVPVKVTMMAAFIVALPVVLYQAWAFVAPGLYRLAVALLALRQHLIKARLVAAPLLDLGTQIVLRLGVAAVALQSLGVGDAHAISTLSLANWAELRPPAVARFHRRSASVRLLRWKACRARP